MTLVDKLRWNDSGREAPGDLGGALVMSGNSESTLSEGYAISFLKQHQPMPDDSRLSEELIAEYDAVRRYLTSNPSEACLPLLLRSFGRGTGLGVYPMMDSVLWPLPRDFVVAQLKEALTSDNPNVRFWCSDLALEFPDRALIDVLGPLLLNDDHDGTRFNAAAILADIEGEQDRVSVLFRHAIEKETDEEVRTLLRQHLGQ